MNSNIYHAYMCVLKHQKKMSEDLVDAIRGGNETIVPYEPFLYWKYLYTPTPFISNLNEPKKKLFVFMEPENEKM